MKARTVWIVLGIALVGLVAWRVVEVKKARSAPVQKASEVALVRVGRVAPADLAEIVSFTGTVRPRNEVEIFPKLGGRIETLDAQIGDKVKAGQLLATIDHKEIGWQAKAAQAALEVARSQLAGAKLEYDRTMSLFKGGSAPQAALDGAKVRLDLAQAQAAQAEAGAGLAQQNLDNARIVTPIAGTVIRRPVNVGAQVGQQVSIFTIQDVATLKLEASVDASGFARLQKGMPAKVTVEALPGETFEGHVSLLSPSLDAATRRAAVEIEIDNGSGHLLPNMFARAEVTVGNLKNALAVPKDAVLEAAGGAVVYRVKGDHVEMVRPRLGSADGARVAVLDGLSDGDLVAVSGVANLADGMPVKIAGNGSANHKNGVD